jgi:hypothetical protein
MLALWQYCANELSRKYVVSLCGTEVQVLVHCKTLEVLHANFAILIHATPRFLRLSCKIRNAKLALFLSQFSHTLVLCCTL